MNDHLTNDLTADEVRYIAEDSDMVAVKLLVDRGVIGYVPRRKHIARQLLATMQENERMRDALRALGPFELVRSDTIHRTTPNSQQKLNSTAAWAVSNGELPTHKLRKYIEQLNEVRK